MRGPVGVGEAARDELYRGPADGRRWYLTALSLFAMGLLAVLFASRPAIAVGIAASPLLYVAWANSRFSLRPALDLSPEPR